MTQHYFTSNPQSAHDERAIQVELAGVRAMQEGIAAGLDYLEIRNRKVGAIRETVKEKIRIFGSVNKA